MKKVVAVASFLALMGSAAHAQTGAAYYGLALGSFDYSEDSSSGIPVIGDTTDSYRLMVGYQFSDHLSVEGGWGETGTIRDSVTFAGLPGMPAQVVNFATEFQILTVRLLGVLNFDNGVTLLGGVGYSDMKQKVDVTVSGFGSSSGESSGSEPAYYLGAQYDWDRVALRVGYEKFDFGGGIDVSESTIAFFYKL